MNTPLFVRRNQMIRQRKHAKLRGRHRLLAERIERLEDRSLMAALSYATAGSNYTQDFNTLIETGTVSPANTTTPIDLDSTTYVRSGQATTSLTGWQFARKGGNTTRFQIDDGSAATSGSCFSTGVTGDTERSLGLLASGSNQSRIGLVITNNTGATLTEFTLSYTGEQWRDGAGTTAVANTLSFGYAVGATNISTGTFSTASSLDFTSPITAANGTNGSNTVLVGNDAANRTAITATVKGLTWTDGTSLVIRWDDTNDPSSDDILSIDDLTFSAIAGVVQPPPTTITVQPDAANTPSTLDDTIVVQDTIDQANQFRVYRDGTNIAIADISSDNTSTIKVTGITGATAFNLDAGGAEVPSGDTGKIVKIPETTIDLYATLKIFTAGGDDTVLLGQNTRGSNDFIPTNDKLSIDLGTGVDTINIDDSRFNAATTTWTVSSADGGDIDVTGSGKLTFAGAENLIGGREADTFVLAYKGASSIATLDGDFGSALDSIKITRNANMTLTNTRLVVDTATTDQTYALANMGRAFLTGGAGANTFDLSGWTQNGDNTSANSYGGEIVGSGGTDVLIKAADLGTTPNVLSRTLIATADGMKLNLVAAGGLNSVTLTDTGSSNTIFEVGDWTKKATLNGGTSTADVFQMTNTAATVVELGLGTTGNVARVNVTESNRITYNDVEVARITGTAADQKVLIYSTAGGTPFNNPRTTIDGAGGYDTFVYDEQTADNLNFTPTDTSITADVTGGGKYTIQSPNFEKMVYDGGGGNNVVDLRGWTGDGEVRGQNGTGDAVLAGSNADAIDLNQQSYIQTFGTGATAVVKTMVLKTVENFSFQGGAANQAISVNNWKQPATLDGGGGTNTLKVFEEQASDFELDDVSATVGKINVTTSKSPTVKKADWLYSNIDSLTVNGGTGANTVTLQSGFDRVLPATAGSLSIRLNTGTDTLNIGGAAGIDVDVTANRVATPSATTPSSIAIGTRVLQFATNGNFPENLVVKGGAGANTYAVTGLTSPATIDGGGGTDSLTITNDAITWVAALGATTSSLRAGSATHTLAGIENVTLEMGAGNHDFTLTGTATNIANLVVNGNDGDDYMSLAGFTGTGLAATLNGGAGNDILFGSAGQNVLNGGLGNDWMSGGDGNDTITGGAGKDIVIGGNGLDNLNGGTDEDLEISGRTSYDTNRSVASALLTYWSTNSSVVGTLSSDGKTATGRIKGLFKDGVTVGATKYYLRVSYPTAPTTATVFNDGAADVLAGGGADAIDWYFANTTGTGTLETISDRDPGESIAEL